MFGSGCKEIKGSKSSEIVVSKIRWQKENQKWQQYCVKPYSPTRLEYEDVLSCFKRFACACVFSQKQLMLQVLLFLAVEEVVRWLYLRNGKRFELI